MNLTFRKIVTNLLNVFSMPAFNKLVKQKFILPFYHSITNTPGKHISSLEYFRSIKNFKDDVDFFKRTYKALTISELSNPQKEKGFFISFDDGLSDIYHNAIPYLLENKLTAAIFVTSDFIDNKSMFYRHKASLILEALKTNPNRTKVADFLHIRKEVIEHTIRQIDYPEASKLDQIAEIMGLSFEQYLDFYKPYLSSTQLSEIQSNGFIIGNHSKDHPNFKHLSFEDQKCQIEVANKILKENFNSDPIYFSFPFGDNQVKKELFNYLFKEGEICLSFGVSGLKSDEFEKHLHRIPMEIGGVSAEKIIKFECFKYLLRTVANRNEIKRA